jgi:hypothetical protein
MFGRFLGQRSYDNPKIFITHKPSSLSITFNGVGFISISTIISITYLGSWAFVILIITNRFMVDQHPFLLKVLT